jgi:photosystem II stability/assembly factor-like uncharacterized protein
MNMRVALVNLCLALCASAASGAQQGVEMQTLRSGTLHDALFAVAFAGNTGIAVGTNGELQESADAGKTWKAVAPAPSKQALFGVAVDAVRAVAVGQLGTILLKPGAGAWSAVKSGTQSRLFAVDEEAKRIVAAGAFGTVIESEDGGATWTSIAPKWADFTDGAEPHIFAVKVHGDAITLAGEFGLILRSDDGGASWHAQHKGDASLFGLDLHDDGQGIAVGQDGAALRTRDDGKTWDALATGSQANLFGVAFAGDWIFIAGMHEALSSADAGRTWQRFSADQIAGWMTGVAIVPGPTVVAVGNAGRIVRFGK